MDAATIERAKLVSMTFDEFLKKFQPIKNPMDPHAQYDGTMFETHGAELEYVKAAPAGTVWTLSDANDVVSLAEGFRKVDRTGFLISQIPAEPGITYEITVADYSQDEDSDEEPED